MLLEVFREAQPHIEALIEEYVQMYKKIHQGDDLSHRIETLQYSIETIQKKSKSC